MEPKRMHEKWSKGIASANPVPAPPAPNRSPPDWSPKRHYDDTFGILFVGQRAESEG